MLPWWLSGKKSTCNAGDVGLIPALGRFPGGGHGNHFSILAWRILWTEEPGRMQSTVLKRIGHDLATEPQQHIGNTQKILTELEFIS